MGEERVLVRVVLYFRLMGMWSGGDGPVELFPRVTTILSSKGTGQGGHSDPFCMTMTMTTYSYSVTRSIWDESDVSTGLEFCARHELPFRKNVMSVLVSALENGNTAEAWL